MALSKHKRPFESSNSSGEGGGQRNSKRPAPSMSNLESHEINGTTGYFSLDDIRQVVTEGVKQANSDLIALIDSRIQDALKGFIPQIHTVLKNVIQEPVCKGMDHANLHSSELVKRTLPESTQTADTRNLQLRLKSNLSLPLYTGMQLIGQEGCPIQVELIDANTGRVVTSGPESSAKLDVVVLKGDFDQEENGTWLVTEFEKYIVKEREGKRPLLTGSGKLQVKLEEGIGQLGDLRFTDNSSWNSCKKFRIGVKVASGSCEGIRVREAITEAFTVRDHRGEAYKKHHPPASGDEIWRLEEIAKGGAYFKRLNEEGICTVEEFMRSLVRDSKKLRNILGSGMPEKKWNVLINHAKKCVPNGKSYIYYTDEKKDYGVVISNICQLKGWIAGREYRTIDQLSESQKAHAEELVKAAGENWDHVEEFGAESFSSPVLNKSMSACPGKLLGNQQPCDDPSDCRLTALSFPRIETSEAPLGSSVSLSGGFTIGFSNVNHNHSVGITLRSFVLPDNTNLTSTVVPEEDVGPWNQQQFFANEDMQHIEPHELEELIKSPSASFMEDILLSTPFDNFDNILPEDVENVDNTGIGSSSNPRFGTKGIGRGVVGWLMLKAIFRWGYFVKKRGHERFVELN